MEVEGLGKGLKYDSMMGIIFLNEGDNKQPCWLRY